MDRVVRDHLVSSQSKISCHIPIFAVVTAFWVISFPFSFSFIFPFFFKSTYLYLFPLISFLSFSISWSRFKIFMVRLIRNHLVSSQSMITFTFLYLLWLLRFEWFPFPFSFSFLFYSFFFFPFFHLLWWRFENVMDCVVRDHLVSSQSMILIHIPIFALFELFPFFTFLYSSYLFFFFLSFHFFSFLHNFLMLIIPICIFFLNFLFLIFESPCNFLLVL